MRVLGPRAYSLPPPTLAAAVTGRREGPDELGKWHRLVMVELEGKIRKHEEELRPFLVPIPVCIPELGWPFPQGPGACDERRGAAGAEARGRTAEAGGGAAGHGEEATGRAPGPSEDATREHPT